MRHGLFCSGWVLVALGCGPGCVVPGARVRPQEERDVVFRVSYTFTVTGTTPWLRVVALVPTTIPRRQRVEDVRFEPEPLHVYEVGGNRYAEFFFSRPRDTVRVQVAGRARLFGYGLAAARAAHARPEAGDLRPFLVDEPCMEKDDPAIAAAARKLVGPDELATLKNTYDFVVGHMTYGGEDLRSPGPGAVQALESGKGDCTEYADLMVALCRANGIPARHVLGLDAAPAVHTRQHAWVEAHTRRYGWVPFDPTFDDCAKAASFERLAPRYLRFSTVRSDPVMENFNAFAMYRWWGDRVDFREEYEIQPVEPRRPVRMIRSGASRRTPRADTSH